MRPPVAITGAGVVSGVGGRGEVCDRVRAGERGSAAVADLPLAGLTEPVRTRVSRGERLTQLVLVAAGQALAEAGRGEGDGRLRASVGVVLGTAFGCFLTNEAHQRRVQEAGPAGASPRLFAATVSNAAAGELGIAYRLGGPAVTLTAGAASGAAALAHALELVRSGDAEAVGAGGADALGPALLRWLEEGGLDAGRPPAEAAAMVVLQAVHVGTRPAPGYLTGVATAFEPRPAAADAGEGLAAAIRGALTDAGVGAGDVALVVTAAPPALRALEACALAACEVASARRIAPKDVLGETFGAAAVLALWVALEGLPAGHSALVLDVCATGHVAALVVRRGEATCSGS